MHIWPLQEAKTRFSEVVELSIKEGPQMIARDGRETVVILAVHDYRRLCGARQDLINCLLNAPKGEAIDCERPNESSRTLPL